MKMALVWTHDEKKTDKQKNPPRFAPVKFLKAMMLKAIFRNVNIKKNIYTFWIQCFSKSLTAFCRCSLEDSKAS